MRVAITGASGLIGSTLRRSLEDDGHDPVAVVRSGGDAGTISWDPAAGRIEPGDFVGIDAVVHLAGEPIGPRRWNEERKRRIRDSRVEGTRLLAEALAACNSRPGVLVTASGIDFYGETGDQQVTEDSPPGSGFMAEVVQAWEGAARPAADAGIRVAHTRSAMVLDPSAGALAQMLPFFKAGIGGRVGSGRQWVSWITLEDEVRIIRWLIDRDVAGPVNAAAPAPVTNAVFTKALGRALHRPTVLPIPSFAPMVLFGREMVETLLLTSHRVLPDRLLDAGFEFHHHDIETALRSALAG